MAGKKTDPKIVENMMLRWSEFVNENYEIFGDREYTNEVTSAIHTMLELGVAREKAADMCEVMGYPEDTAEIYNKFIEGEQNKLVAPAQASFSLMKENLARVLLNFCDGTETFTITFK